MAHTPSRYEAARKAACPHCAAEIQLSSNPHVHWCENKPGVKAIPCAAPTLEQWAEEQAEMADLAVQALYVASDIERNYCGVTIWIADQAEIDGPTLLEALRDAAAKGYLPEAQK